MPSKPKNDTLAVRLNQAETSSVIRILRDYLQEHISWDPSEELINIASAVLKLRKTLKVNAGGLEEQHVEGKISQPHGKITHIKDINRRKPHSVEQRKSQREG